MQDTEEDVFFDGGYQVPGSIFSRLFDYQKTGVSHMFPLVLITSPIARVTCHAVQAGCPSSSQSSLLLLLLQAGTAGHCLCL